MSRNNVIQTKVKLIYSQLGTIAFFNVVDISKFLSTFAHFFSFDAIVNLLHSVLTVRARVCVRAYKVLNKI